MAERGMADALSSSLNAEELSLTQRIANAEEMLGTRNETLAIKPKQDKVIRDGFSMPGSDHALIAEIQRTAIQAGFHMSKSEIFRAALRVLNSLSAEELQETYESLERVKPGRPTI